MLRFQWFWIVQAWICEVENKRIFQKGRAERDGTGRKFGSGRFVASSSFTSSPPTPQAIDNQHDQLSTLYNVARLAAPFAHA
jgi:hypothetical protein